MICLGYIDPYVLEDYEEGAVNENLLNFLKSIIQDYDRDNSNIVLVDNRKNEFLNLIVKLLSSEKTNQKFKSILSDFFLRIKNFEVQPLIKSDTNNPTESKYVDFQIVSDSMRNEKNIDIDDPNFEDKINEFKSKYSISIITNKYNEKDFKSLFYNLEKIFLSSDKISFLRTHAGQCLLPSFNGEFVSIDRLTGKYKKDFDLHLSTLNLLILLIANIKRESFFSNKDKRFEINIFSDLQDKSLSSDDYVIDENFISNIFDSNFSKIYYLKPALEKFNIKINFFLFIYKRKDEGQNKEIAKDCLHLRILSSSMGSFYFGHEKLLELTIDKDARSKHFKKLHTFNIIKATNEDKKSIESTVLNNINKIIQLKTSYPN